MLAALAPASRHDKFNPGKHRSTVPTGVQQLSHTLPVHTILSHTIFAPETKARVATSPCLSDSTHTRQSFETSRVAMKRLRPEDARDILISLNHTTDKLGAKQLKN